MILNTKFHEILFISSRATLATKFLSQTHRRKDRHTDRQTDRHFPEIVKSSSYIEESKKICWFYRNYPASKYQEKIYAKNDDPFFTVVQEMWKFLCSLLFKMVKHRWEQTFFYFMKCDLLVKIE